MSEQAMAATVFWALCFAVVGFFIGRAYQFARDEKQFEAEKASLLHESSNSAKLINENNQVVAKYKLERMIELREKGRTHDAIMLSQSLKEDDLLPGVTEFFETAIALRNLIPRQPFLVPEASQWAEIANKAYQLQGRLDASLATDFFSVGDAETPKEAATRMSEFGDSRIGEILLLFLEEMRFEFIEEW